jgi:hypothetical protein
VSHCQLHRYAGWVTIRLFSIPGQPSVESIGVFPYIRARNKNGIDSRPEKNLVRERNGYVLI